MPYNDRTHEIEIIDTTQCQVNLAAQCPQVLYPGNSLTGYDAAIPRNGASITEHELHGMCFMNPFACAGPVQAVREK